MATMDKFDPVNNELTRNPDISHQTDPKSHSSVMTDTITNGTNRTEIKMFARTRESKKIFEVVCLWFGCSKTVQMIPFARKETRKRSPRARDSMTFSTCPLSYR
jgi:hypothetical protein